MRILIMEENSEECDRLRAELYTRGHVVQTAADVPSVLDAIREFLPHLILCDIDSDDVDTLKLIQAIRRRKSPPSIVLMTSFRKNNQVFQALRIGAFDYLHKPVSANDLNKVVDRAVSRITECEPTGAGPGRHTLLLVDDNEKVLKALRRTLMPEGYRVVTAETVDTAYELLKIEEVSLIISDWKMPGVEGEDFLKKVSALYPHVVKIVLTGYSNVEALAATDPEIGVFRFLLKPWETEELREAVCRGLEIRSAILRLIQTELQTDCLLTRCNA